MWMLFLEGCNELCVLSIPCGGAGLACPTSRPPCQQCRRLRRARSSASWSLVATRASGKVRETMHGTEQRRTITIRRFARKRVSSWFLISRYYYRFTAAAICERLLTEWKDTHVLLGSRSQERGQQAVDDLIATIGGDCQERLQLLVLDTSSDDSVRQAANKLQESGDTNLYGIINNAGVRKCLRRVCQLC
jgi:hypothetical protein